MYTTRLGERVYETLSFSAYEPIVRRRKQFNLICLMDPSSDNVFRQGAQTHPIKAMSFGQKPMSKPNTGIDSDQDGSQNYCPRNRMMCRCFLVVQGT